MTDLRQPIAPSRPRRTLVASAAALATALIVSVWSGAGFALAATPGTRATPAMAATQLATAAAAAPAAPSRTDSSTPSIQYEESLIHAGDANPFARPAAGDPVVRVSLRARMGQSTAATAIVPATKTALQPPSSGLRRDVFGFLPYWELSDPSLSLAYTTLSTIAYFSVAVDPSGNLVRTNSDGSASTGWAGWTSSQLTNVINAAHQQGVRVVLCVTLFGWSSTEAATQGAMLGNAAARDNLAQQAAKAVADRGADGINLDFEPIVSGHSADFTALVRGIRAQLDAQAPGSLLTFDATAEVGNYPVTDATAPGAADAIFVMGYDYRTAGSTLAGAVAPLNGPTYDLNDTLAAYLSRTSASKLILGIPYYGRAWSTVSDAANAKSQSGTKFGSSTSVTYTSAADLAAQYGRRYDAIEESAWTAYERQNCTSTYGCVTSWRELYYDDAQSLAAKYDLVNRLGLRGVGMWALGYDGTRPELASALAAKFSTDTTPPMAGIVALPPTQAADSFAVSWLATDNLSGVVAMDVDVSVDGGPWTLWLAATTATSAIYAGTTGHTFAFRVRATDGQGLTSPYGPADAGMANPNLGPGGFARVAVDSLSVRAGPDLTAQKVASLNTGALVAITGGPVVAGGLTWYQVTEPIREWPAVSPVLAGVWVAAAAGGTPYLTAVRAPNSTTVGAAGPDTTPPSLTAGIPGPLLLSPNGDGRLDTLDVRGTAAGGSIWSVLISSAADPSGAAVRSLAGTGEAIAATWDGRDGAGAVLPDGAYRLRLVAADASGNQASQEWIVVIDTTPPAGGTGPAPPTLSPNGDGDAETTSLRWNGGDVASGLIEVLKSSTVIRSAALAPGTSAWTWDGRDGHGRGVSDGRYVLRLTLRDAAGNDGSTLWTAVVDRTAGMVRWSPTRFAPGGSGGSARAGSSTVSYLLTRTASTTLVIRDQTGRSIRTAVATGSVAGKGPHAWTWNGRDAKGHLVPPGRYVAALTVRTSLGATTLLRTVVVQ